MIRRLLPLDLLSLVPGAVPLHRQLYGQLRDLIVAGTVSPGATLPSGRMLADELGVSRNTVVAAYDQLASEGYVEIESRRRPTVAVLGPAAPPPATAEALSLSARGSGMMAAPRQRALPGRPAFHPGTPDLSVFPFADWRKLMGRRIADPRADLYGYYHLSGHPALRAAIARYLAAARGVRCRPEEILVTTGAQAALDLVARLLTDPGDTVWMEEPGYLGAQSAFLAAGARLEPLRVDDAGWSLGTVPDPPPKVIYATPSCQFPLGPTMRMDQRLRLMEIARTTGAVVLEDDFDSEYRFVGSPIPSMQGIDTGGRTVYLGTFAKTLFPAIRIGFVVLPGDLAARAAEAINVTGQYPPLLLQATLADFIEEGHFARHLNRTRRLYARRREAFVAAAGAALSGFATYSPCDAGLQTLWRLPDGVDDAAIAAEAERKAIVVGTLSRHYRAGPGRPGLILGYTGTAEEETARALAALRPIVAGHAR
jgi:GntR family transcriptional regulator/MocR family aminotransferase